MPGISKTPQSNPEGYQNPKEHGLNYEDIYFNTSDGTQLHSWLIFSNTNQDSKKKSRSLFFSKETPLVFF